MAVNLTPQYHAANEQYSRAKTTEDKLQWLRAMWVELPKHKASEKVQASLKTKISELTDELEREKSGPRKSAPGTFKFPRQGAGQIVILGGPNAGKSRLLTRLTRATPEVAPYPFTTREPLPGMMDFEDIRIQLIDTPPITEDMYEPFITDLTRSADAAVLLVDLGDDDGPFAVDVVLARLKEARRVLVPVRPETDDDPTVYVLPTLLVANKSEADGAMDRLEFLKDVVGDRFPILSIDAESGKGMDEFKAELWKILGLMRIYSKTQGKPADMVAPFTIPHGSNVVDFAEKIHSDLAEKVKSARVWGSAAFDGQVVGKEHILEEKDIVELQT